MAVDEALKAASIECRIQLVGKLQIIAAVGDEDAKLAPVGRVGSARLLRRSYITRFQRSRTGCVMRDVCHCAAPIAALNISTFGKVGGSPTSRQSLGVAASRLARRLLAPRHGGLSHPKARRGCGRPLSASTKTARRRTATSRRARPLTLRRREFKSWDKLS